MSDDDRGSGEGGPRTDILAASHRGEKLVVSSDDPAGAQEYLVRRAQERPIAQATKESSSSSVQFMRMRLPLPPPELLEAYKQTIPDLPERMAKQWELDAEHRRTMASNLQRAELVLESRRVHFAFFVAVGGVLLTAGLGHLGLAGAAAVASLSPLGGIGFMVASFLRRQRRERSEGRE